MSLIQFDDEPVSSGIQGDTNGTSINPSWEAEKRPSLQQVVPSTESSLPDKPKDLSNGKGPLPLHSLLFEEDQKYSQLEGLTNAQKFCEVTSAEIPYKRNLFLNILTINNLHFLKSGEYYLKASLKDQTHTGPLFKQQKGVDSLHCNLDFTL
jgi:hypothetical protein